MYKKSFRLKFRELIRKFLREKQTAKNYCDQTAAYDDKFNLYAWTRGKKVNHGALMQKKIKACMRPSGKLMHL